MDDEPINLMCLKRLFLPEFEVFTARSGEEALELLSKERMDAVVSDQRMPNFKGTDLFSAVRDRTRTGLRIILTGYAQDPEIHQALQENTIDMVLEKPVESKIIMDLLCSINTTGGREP